jgi:hypothetical protein
MNGGLQQSAGAPAIDSGNAIAGQLVREDRT